MNIVENEMIVAIDVDGTLIRPDPQGAIKLPYGSTIHCYEPIMEHVDLLKSYKQRGFYVIVWSHGGNQHAKLTIQALKLERYVDLVLTKPSKHVDDKTSIEDIVGTRVFISQREQN